MPAYAQIITYFLAIFLVGFILIAVDWAKVVRRSHRSFGIALYLIVSLALGFGVGSFVVKIVSLAMGS